MSITKYYQVGGFRPDIRWFEGDWNDKQLVNLLAGQQSPLRSGAPDNSIELALGIKPTGASCLLLADIQANLFEISRKKRFHGHTTAADYESISPIYFKTADELHKKLATLKPKQRKGNKADPWDTSSANKAYKEGNSGAPRGEFENERVLYRLLQKSIGPAVYNISDISWTQNVRILSFVCNLRAVDFRPYEERSQFPRPLDYGWAEADARSPHLTLKPKSAVHLMRAEDRLLGTGRAKVPFEHGTTQYATREELESIVQGHFKEFHDEYADAPAILLVHDEKLARSALQELGVQTSTWKSGISDLLRPKVRPGFSGEHTVSSSSRPGPGRFPSPNDHEIRNQRSRERSRSPSRRTIPDTSDPEAAQYAPLRRRSPTMRERQRYSPVYILDLRALYRTMMQTQNEKLLVEIYQRLNLTTESNSWCAGNEAVMIFQAWHSMVSGVTIDEQRSLRANSAIHHAATIPGQPQQQQPAPLPLDSDDEEFDPNDIVQISNAAQSSAIAGDESETDYGSDY